MWPPFALAFADPFIEGTELEQGKVMYSLTVLGYMLGRILGTPEGRARLPLLGDDEFRALQDVKDMMLNAEELCQSAEKVEDANGLRLLAGAWQEKIEATAVGEMILLPGGWKDGLGRDVNLIHVVERTAADSFAFVTCNTGDGLKFHPSTARVRVSEECDTMKLKYRTCIRLEGVPAAKITSPAFLALLLSQRIQHENHRAEIVYDGLLPWLAGGPLNPALEATADDVGGEWRTGARANTTSYRSVLEAVRYILRRKGLQTAQLKQLTYQLRQEMVNQAHEDLRRMTDPAAAAVLGLRGVASAVRAGGEAGGAALDLLRGLGPDLLCRQPPPGAGPAAGVGYGPIGTTDAAAALDGRHVAIYFSAHW
jgi:hypothetical protein